MPKSSCCFKFRVIFEGSFRYNGSTSFCSNLNLFIYNFFCAFNTEAVIESLHVIVPLTFKSLFMFESPSTPKSLSTFKF